MRLIINLAKFATLVIVGALIIVPSTGCDQAGAMTGDAAGASVARAAHGAIDYKVADHSRFWWYPPPRK